MSTPTTEAVIPADAATAVIVQHCPHQGINTYVTELAADRARDVLAVAARLGWLAVQQPGQTQEAVVVGHNEHGMRVGPPTHVVPNMAAFAWLVDNLRLRAGRGGCGRCCLMGRAA